MRTTIWICAVCTIAALCRCGEKENEPTSSIGGYTPEYLDEKGTVYDGEYMPLTEGHTWVYDGESYTTVVSRSSGEGAGISIDTTYYDTVSTTILTARLIEKAIEYEGITLIPRKTVSIENIDDSLIGYEGTEFFELSDTGVFLRMIAMDDEYGVDTIEIEPMLYIKRPLVVGDYWVSTPGVEMTSLTQTEFGEEVSYMNAETHVIGKETITVKDREIEAIRLEQVFESTYSIDDSLGRYESSQNGVAIIYVVKDTGTVHEEENGSVSMNLTMTDIDGTYRDEVEFTTTESLDLTGFNEEMPSTLLKRKPVSAPGVLSAPNTSDSAFHRNASVMRFQRLARLLRGM
jgi:hypothetical protein